MPTIRLTPTPNTSITSGGTTYLPTASGGVSNASYSTARGAEPSINQSFGTYGVGQDKDALNFYIYTSYLEFDTRFLQNCTINSAKFIVTFFNRSTSTNFVAQVRLYDWGDPPISAGDGLTGSELSAYTLLASRDTSTMTSNSSDKDFTDAGSGVLAANLNKGGYTRLVLCSKRTVDNIQPTGSERINLSQTYTFLEIGYTLSSAASPQAASPSNNYGTILSSSTTSYSQAKAGTGTLTVGVSGGSLEEGFGVKYYSDKYGEEWNSRLGFVEFDTSFIGANSILSATLQVYITNPQDYNVWGSQLQARLNDYGNSLTTADWVTHANLGSKTLLATYSDATFANAGYRTMTDSALASNINKTGLTRIIFCTDRQANDSSWVNELTSAGFFRSPIPPLLTITYTSQSAVKFPKITVLVAGT